MGEEFKKNKLEDKIYESKNQNFDVLTRKH